MNIRYFKLEIKPETWAYPSDQIECATLKKLNIQVECYAPNGYSRFAEYSYVVPNDDLVSHFDVIFDQAKHELLEEMRKPPAQQDSDRIRDK